MSVLNKSISQKCIEYFDTCRLLLMLIYNGGFCVLNFLEWALLHRKSHRHHRRRCFRWTLIVIIHYHFNSQLSLVLNTFFGVWLIERKYHFTQRQFIEANSILYIKLNIYKNCHSCNYRDSWRLFSNHHYHHTFRSSPTHTHTRTQKNAIYF